MGAVDGVVTCDTDLIFHGCKLVLFRRKRETHGENPGGISSPEVCSNPRAWYAVTSNEVQAQTGFSVPALLALAAHLGCDYAKDNEAGSG